MEASTPTLPQGEALYGKLPPDAGEWLFKDKDQVLGPVPPEMLITKLYDGFLTADTPVAKEVGQWKPLKEIWFLGAHVPRAQQKMAFESAVQERARMASTQLKTRALLAFITFALLFTGALAAARWVMITRPWEDKTDWLTRRPPAVQLPDRTPKVVAVVEKEEPKRAGEGTTPPPADDKKPAPSDDKKPVKGTKATTKAPGKEPAKGAKEEPVKPKEDVKKPEEVKPAPVKTVVPQELTKEQMTSVFKGGAGGYMQCIREEAARNPNMPGTITVEFVIKNTGGTTDFKVQEREIRTGPLATCLGAKIGALRFPQFSGENKVFMFPFRITRK